MRMCPLLCLCLTLALLLSSCSLGAALPPSASEVLAVMLETMQKSCQPLPDGRIYDRSLSQGAPLYLSDTFLSALYGEAARGLFASDDGGAPPVSDAAIFLSLAAYPCELAVFRCSDARTAATLASLCRSRLDSLARGYAATEWASLASRSQVSVKGCFVLLALCDDPPRVIRAARGATP